jgi:hypothetical protein
MFVGTHAADHHGRVDQKESEESYPVAAVGRNADNNCEQRAAKIERFSALFERMP